MVPQRNGFDTLLGKLTLSIDTDDSGMLDTTNTRFPSSCKFCLRLRDLATFTWCPDSHWAVRHRKRGPRKGLRGHRLRCRRNYDRSRALLSLAAPVALGRRLLVVQALVRVRLRIGKSVLGRVGLLRKREIVPEKVVPVVQPPQVSFRFRWFWKSNLL